MLDQHYVQYNRDDDETFIHTILNKQTISPKKAENKKQEEKKCEHKRMKNKV